MVESMVESEIKITPNLIVIFFLFFLLKIHLVMKTALFKLLNQTIIPRYATNYKQYKIYPFDLTKRAMRSIPLSICSSEHAKDKRT